MKFIIKKLVALVVFVSIISIPVKLSAQVYVANQISGSACISSLKAEETYTVQPSFVDPAGNDFCSVIWTVSNPLSTITYSDNNSVKIRWNSLPSELKVTVSFYQNWLVGHDEYGDEIYQPYLVSTAYSTISPSPSVVNYPNTISSANGNTKFNYNTIPDGIIEVFNIASQPSCSAPSYQWQSSFTLDNFVDISGATSANLSFNTPLSQTTFFRRAVYDANGNISYSNIVKLEAVSLFWEDKNYVREHTVLVAGITDWKTVDQLPIGQKLQSTSYVDEFGRPIQKINKQVAPNTGDLVQFYEYDEFGRQLKQFLPYVTTTESGSFKSNPNAELNAYYANPATYNESSPYAAYLFENSPLNRIKTINQSGASWAASQGVSQIDELNTIQDNIQIFSIGYGASDKPVSTGVYPANSLFKKIHISEDNSQVVEFYNSAGQLIVKKVQLNNNPGNNATDWICTYNIYDDFGRVRFQIQPEGVKYLELHNWSFTINPTEGQRVVDELCFVYQYDDKGRVITKKAPGVKELNMIYDMRDRLVFAQDGNQNAKATPEWMTTIYDELDRPVVTARFATTQSKGALTTIVNNAVTINTINIVNAGDPINNLVLDKRIQNTQHYKAQQSIEFVSDSGGDFESASNDFFDAAIDSSAVTQGLTVNIATFGSPLTPQQLNDPTQTTVLKYQFYDNYNFNGLNAFSSFFNGFINTTAYSNADLSVEPIQATQRTIGLITRTQTRVLGTNAFLTETFFYDEKGRALQSQRENVKSGNDIVTSQYHFSGRLLSTHAVHSTGNSGYSNFHILSKYSYDNIGRRIKLEEKYADGSLINSTAFKRIAAYDYDDFGRLKTKHLAPGYNNPTTGKNELESLTYTYNIHSNITGINKDFALKTSGYNKWGNYFGLYLGFDNRDNVFNKANLNGQVTGLLWNTQGDDAQRKYEYDYDNAGRLVNAAFTEKQNPTDAWNTAKADFTVTGNSGKITYDLNGNLQNMIQKTVIAGQGIVQMDNLTYTYAAYSNKLMKVTDNGTAGTANGSFGDFKDGTNTGDDYVYDDNGNLIIDLNKGVVPLSGGGGGISYNYLDKPEQIRIAGKGTIKIVYDADGNKLQRIYTPDGSTTAKTTTYINRFVYEETAPVTGGAGTGLQLQYINFEEGRIRLMQPVSSGTTDNTGTVIDALMLDGNLVLPGTKKGSFDYFVRDYQQNVRMILTEESHISYSTATMETARAAAEDAVFGQAGAGNEVEATRTAKPGGWVSNTSAGVSMLSKASGNTIGPNSLLKVMAGDAVTATVQYYYTGTTGNNTNSLATDILASLLQTLNTTGAVNSSIHNNTGNIISNLNSTPLINVADPHQYSYDGQRRAYLTVLFFDERFNFVSEGSALQRVSQSDDGATPLLLADIKAPKNGYAYVYVSNESNEPVYFDNLKISLARGRIIEENHYYAYGLKIAAISSRKLGDANEGSLKNQYQYQGDYSEFDDETGWNDFELRSYDPQIGRFIQADPYDQFPSPYTGMGNDPINGADPNGGFYNGVNWLGIAGDMTAGQMLLSRAINTVAGAALGWGIDKLSGGDGKKGAIIGAGVGLAATYIPWDAVGSVLGNGAGWLGRAASDAANVLADVVRTQQQRDDRIIKRTLDDLDKKLDDALNSILNWEQKDKKNFKEHFGADDDASRDKIKDMIIKESKQVHQYQSNPDNNKIERTNTQPSGTFAYVYPNDQVQHKIHLEKQFWKARRKGRDSKLGTFAHEISHFKDVGGTSDNGYGAGNARRLTSTPANALNNADNFEYYIEKTHL
ncbi:MAG: hypothetical protein J0I09_14915 [Sphingobacteriia bacterium]|nr:hypothetical protein [Sphingobacteriia bacterium]